jgi:3-oxoacyl-[acyl-carrier protein] reductase
MTSLAGKVALVTGSSRGIGAAIAMELAARGAAVAVHGRDADALTRVRADIEAAGGRAIAVTGDVTHFADLEAMRAEIEQALGPIDLLVANAGANPVPPGPIEEITEAGWRDSLDVNLTATFLTVKSVLPGMKERGAGAIVTISSAAGRRAHPGSPVAYAVAKAGVQLLTQDIAAQAGPFGVRANCVAPETILTETNQQRIPAAVQQSLRDSHPIRRLGTPPDIAHAVAYLVSDEASWVTGIVLDVAGGAVMV